ncbi:FCD domain-containing protein [Pseudooceanicola sp. GBMRC 2024]|uniref:FCD domain-containing protein n=1 Tax=Pseudooceanicola albus TaxID=2692189 RepID=A0A6L7G137_9RHOB|nr:GntR family transcriptional regulator [Pseudooceanicola albus]MXN17765.1 FCD domain-containing protein [Pseudooceanicola albus]
MTEQPRKKRGSVQAAVLQRLQEGLMEGALMPGQVIRVRQFATFFETSPMPVRDALSQLVAVNALEEMPNGSVRVPVLSEARLRELFEIRQVLECRAARAACTRATPALIESLKALNAPFMPAEAEVRLPKLEALRANRNFHFTLYRGAGSEVLMPLIASLWMQCGPTLHLTLETPTAVAARARHQQILEALEARDPEAITEALRAEIEEIASTILSGYAAALTRGPLAYAGAGIDLFS